MNIYVFLCNNIDIRKNTYNNIVVVRDSSMPLTSKQMIKLLKKNGFEIVSQNGSHIKLKNQITGICVIVPCHCKDLKKGLEQAILKQAGIK